MFIKTGSASPRHGWTLFEMMIAVAAFTIGGLALMTLTTFSARSYTALLNYSVLDQQNRHAMDTVTCELRQAKRVTGYATNATSSSITFISGDDDQPVTYTFDAQRQQVRRTHSGQVNVILTNCNLLNFGLYMRPPAPPTNSDFGFYPVVMNPDWEKTVKVVQLTWKTGMTLAPTTRVNSEDVQTACVVIRKQQDN